MQKGVEDNEEGTHTWQAALGKAACSPVEGAQLRDHLLCFHPTSFNSCLIPLGSLASISLHSSPMLCRQHFQAAGGNTASKQILSHYH